MSINEVQDQIVNEFSQFKDLSQKYEYIISLAKKHEPLEPQFKTEDYAIKGCASTVWITMQVMDDGTIMLHGDTDTMITKGILSLIIRIFNYQKLVEVAKTNLYFAEKIGLRKHLSPSRVNGLDAMIQHIKEQSKLFMTNN